jgi:transcriptional regulator with XRE-family HTH domain
MIGLRIDIEPICDSDIQDTKLRELFDIADEMKISLNVLMKGYKRGAYRFGDKLNELMNSRKMNERELAKISKVSHTEINMLSRNFLVSLPYDKVKDIARGLGVPVEELTLNFVDRPAHDILCNIHECFNTLKFRLRAMESKLISLLMCYEQSILPKEREELKKQIKGEK